MQLLNFDMRVAGEKKMLQLNEIEEFHNNVYENASIYKERTKQWHDKLIMSRDFKKGQKVLLFNSRLRLFPGKLRSRWSGPFEVTQVLPQGAIEIHSPIKKAFKIDGQQFKPYMEGYFTKHNVSFRLNEAP